MSVRSSALAVIFIFILGLSSQIGAAPLFSGFGPSSSQSPQIASLSAILKGNADSPITEIPIPENSSQPLAINVDSGGHVWFAESGTHQIVEYFPSTGRFLNFPIPTPAHVGLIWFIVFDNAGNIWFSDASQPLLWSLSPSSGQFANFSTGSQQADPYAIAYDSSANQVWFTSTYTGQIGVFQIEPNESARLLKLVSVPAPDGAYQTPSSPIVGPSGISLDSQGNVFVTESFAGAITEYSSGAFVRIWKLPPASQPVGISIDQSRGRIWFTNHASSEFGYVVESTGQVIEMSSSLFSRDGDAITLPYWIELGPSGLIWFDEHFGNKIARFDPESMTLTEFLVPANASEPLRFTFDNSRGLLWFTEFSGNNLGVLSQNDSIQSIFSLSPLYATLSGNSVSLSANYASGAAFSPLVSGSPSPDGHLGSNLTFSTQKLNSTQVELILNRGENLAPGNYTVTICPRLSASDSESNPPPTRVCAIIFLNVENQTFLGLDQNEVYLLAGILIVIIAIVSFLYVRKWNHSFTRA